MKKKPPLIERVTLDDTLYCAARYDEDEEALHFVVAGVCPQGSEGNDLLSALTAWLHEVSNDIGFVSVKRIEADFTALHYQWGDRMLGVVGQLLKIREPAMQPGGKPGEVMIGQRTPTVNLRVHQRDEQAFKGIVAMFQDEPALKFLPA